MTELFARELCPNIEENLHDCNPCTVEAAEKYSNRPTSGSYTNMEFA